ncbi:uncharacterized protein [Anabrus simplex]|uniref:uncharacterized protein n=1 Tax=Anabrus simplex TaxID=316456 RepID=UPI0034DCCEF9
MRFASPRLWLYTSAIILVVIGLRVLIIKFFHIKEVASSVKNIIWSEEFVVPNVVHYIFFNKDVDFMAFLSILSVIKVQHPERLVIHCNCKSFSGRYWSSLKAIPSVELHYLSQPTHVYGQVLSSVYHATDVARIMVLMEWGGIYVDSDVILIQCLDEFRHYEMALGWPHGQYIGTQILLARKGAQFLSLWLDGYRRYQPRAWYYNAGQYPTEQILEKHPGLVHYERVVFGVHNLLDKLYGTAPWPEWHNMTAIHTLGRHHPAPQNMNETFVLNYKTPFGEIARWVLYELEPKIIPQR